jgi:hypothetical protein
LEQKKEPEGSRPDITGQPPRRYTMSTIKSEIRRQTTIMFSVFLLAFVIGPAVLIFNFGGNRMIAFTIIPCEVFAIPLFVAWGVRIGKLRKIQHDQRIEAYRASPESHLLNLGEIK